MASRLYISFQAKVLTMIAAAMLTLMGVTIWIVNSHVTAQLERDAAESLMTADSVFRNMQRVRAKNLILRFGNVPNESSRFRALAQLNDAPTMRYLLRELAKQYEADVVVFLRPDLRTLASASRDPTVDLSEFEVAAHDLARNALAGQPVYSTDHINHQIHDLIGVPVIVSDEMVGVLVFAVECGQSVIREFRQLTRCDVVLLADDHVTASTLPESWLSRTTVRSLRAALDNSGTLNVDFLDQITKLDLGNEHMMAIGSRFKSMTRSHVLGYLIVSSYEGPLAALRMTQHSLFLLGMIGLTMAMLVAWLLVRRITQPLRTLRDVTVAVGQGDFSQQTRIHTRDECGQLAEAFNAMIRNLAGARAELEQTVETLRSTRDQLTQSEKLSAIGEFVAGVTHELNNPLTSVIGFAELLQRSKLDDRNRRQVDLIAREAHRCHKIVQSLLSFARQHKPERKPINVNESLDAAIDILAYQMRTSNVQIERRLSPQLPAVVADQHQLQQVFINMLNNARQAIEGHRPDGRIRVSTRATATQVEIVFHDNGPGIASENLVKIFDPFFTTKEVGKGTGLGLSLCYGIVQEHGGTLQVQSPPGDGAKFLISLPVAIDLAPVTETPSTAAPATVPHAGQGRRVLVVDDEESILNLAREVLIGERYEVDIASDGDTAIRKAHQKRYDVIVCDWKMPGLTGRQVYEHLCVHNPEAAEHFIFMTGDIISDTTREFLEQHSRQCLSKPFSLTDFSAAINTILAASRN